MLLEPLNPGSSNFSVAHDPVSFDLNLPSSALTLNSRSAETKIDNESGSAHF
jgi:hypothetical protein